MSDFEKETAKKIKEQLAEEKRKQEESEFYGVKMSDEENNVVEQQPEQSVNESETSEVVEESKQESVVENPEQSSILDDPLSGKKRKKSKGILSAVFGIEKAETEHFKRKEKIRPIALIYSILSNLISKTKNVMTLESIAKYKLKNVSQCELNENIGFNLDKAMRFIEFQSPDIIYFEGIATKEGLDFFTSLTLKNKALITEFLAENMDDLRRKFEFSEFTMFKSVISCLIFIHNKESIEVFDKNDLEKYLF